MDEQTTETLDMTDAIEFMRQLLPLLRENDVHSCQVGGVTVVFNEKQVYEGIAPTAQPAMEKDDGHSTSNKRVSGFKDPALWQWQNGKVLTFTGSLE